MAETLNGFYPDAEDSVVKNVMRSEDRSVLDKINDCPRVPTSPIPLDVLEPESVIQRKCQRAEDFARAIPHLFDYLPEPEMKALCMEASDAAQHAISAIFVGRLSVNPASTQALVQMALGTLLEHSDTTPLHVTIQRVIKLMMNLRGPSAHMELTMGLKASMEGMFGTSEASDEDDPPSIRLPIGFNGPTAKKTIIH